MRHSLSHASETLLLVGKLKWQVHFGQYYSTVLPVIYIKIRWHPEKRGVDDPFLPSPRWFASSQKHGNDAGKKDAVKGPGSANGGDRRP